MPSDLQTRTRERGDTVQLFCEMITAASQSLDLEPQDVAAIARSTDWMAEELQAMISDLTAQRTDQDHIDRLRSLIEALRLADDLVQRKVVSRPGIQ